MTPTIFSIGGITKNLFTAATMAAAIFSTTNAPATLYSVANTPFMVSSTPAVYISPLTTDLLEVLLDDSFDYYLTFE